MNKFARISEHIIDTDIEVVDGRAKSVALLGRLDASWDSVSKTTLGVMLAVVACSKDKGVAINCLSKMLFMMSKMSDVYGALLGWQSEPVEHSEMMKMSDEVDHLGNELMKSCEGIGAAVMVELLAALPRQWTMHFQLVVEAKASMTKVLSSSAASYVAGQLEEVQRSLMLWLTKMVGRTAFTLNSKPAIKAHEWAVAAGSVYDAVRVGMADDVAFAEAIRKVGFPTFGGA